jgi:hypothetical protein
MKYLLLILLLILSQGCQLGSSQQPNEETIKEQKYRELIKKARAMQETRKEAIKIASRKADSVLVKTKERIITLTKIVYVLKEQNQNLKTKVNDDDDNNGSAQPFNLLAVPSDRDH